MSRPAMAAHLRSGTKSLHSITSRARNIQHSAPTIEPHRYKSSTAYASAEVNGKKHPILNNEPASSSSKVVTAEPCMTTYSTFNPGATRPLVASSITLPHPRKTAHFSHQNMEYMQADVPPRPEHIPTAFTTTTVVATTAATATATNTTATDTTTSPPSDSATNMTAAPKPWPYTLPPLLRPRAGTTFASLHGRSTGSGGDRVAHMAASPKEYVSIFQALLYGIPEPDKFSFWEALVGQRKAAADRPEMDTGFEKGETKGSEK